MERLIREIALQALALYDDHIKALKRVNDLKERELAILESDQTATLRIARQQVQATAWVARGQFRVAGVTIPNQLIRLSEE